MREDTVNVMSIHATNYVETMKELIKKLILDQHLVGEKKNESLAFLMQEFWNNLNLIFRIAQDHTTTFGLMQPRKTLWFIAGTRDFRAVEM